MFKFQNLQNARSFQNRSSGLMVVLGDDARYWVTSRRMAARLVKQGYELI